MIAVNRRFTGKSAIFLSFWGLPPSLSIVLAAVRAHGDYHFPSGNVNRRARARRLTFFRTCPPCARTATNCGKMLMLIAVRAHGGQVRKNVNRRARARRLTFIRSCPPCARTAANCGKMFIAVRVVLTLFYLLLGSCRLIPPTTRSVANRQMLSAKSRSVDKF